MLQLVAALFLVIVTAELGGSSVITAPSIRRRQSGCVGNLKSFQVGVIRSRGIFCRDFSC